MSLLSLKQRERGSAPSSGSSAPSSGSPDESFTTLADLVPGRCARILDVCDEAQPATARRLVDLGFAPGAMVTVIRRAPLADPVIFRVAGQELALRRCQARCIRVCAEA